MPKAIRDTFQGVAGGWWIVDPDTGTKIEGNSYRNLKHAWMSHRKANDLTWNNVEDWISDQICIRAPDACQERDTRGPAPNLNGLHRLPWRTLIANYVTESVKWAKAGFPLPSEQELKHRAETCEVCPKWNPRGYAGLGKCNECGCSGGKLHYKTSHCPLKKW